MSWGKGGPVPLVLVLAGALAVGGCATTNQPATVTTTVATTVARTTTTSTVPPTTVYQARAPQPSRNEAAGHLMVAWKAGDRGAAAADASPAAVSALFAQPYPPGGVEFRQCQAAVAGASDCTYRILDTGRLLLLSEVEGPGGWITQAVRFLS